MGIFRMFLLGVIAALVIFFAPLLIVGIITLIFIAWPHNILPFIGRRTERIILGVGGLVLIAASFILPTL